VPAQAQDTGEYIIEQINAMRQEINEGCASM